jgi:hypothetical protein
MDEEALRAAERTYLPIGGRALLQVTHDREIGMRMLLHQGTRHGMQSLDPALVDEPLGYYTRGAPFDDVLGGWGASGRTGRVGVVGLGIGVLAAYARPGQHWVFWEIDPRVASVAQDPSLFTFLSRCHGTTEVIVGDGLECLGRAADGELDVLVLDAFVGAVIPEAFIRREALELYCRKIARDGLIVFHINSLGQQLPELRALAAAAGLTCCDRLDEDLESAAPALCKMESLVVVMMRDARAAPWLRDHPLWRTSAPPAAPT